MIDENIEAVITKLKEKNKEYLDKTKKYDDLYEKYSKSLQVSNCTLTRNCIKLNKMNILCY